MKNNGPIVIGIIIFFAIIVGAIIAAFYLSSGKQIKTYSNSDPVQPKISVSETEFDLGKISVKDIAVREVIITNLGNAPLIVSNTYTSCDCTSAQWTIEGIESKIFSMNKDKSWQGEIPAGAISSLGITYEPKIMPVKGKVKRTTTFSTNDPQKPLINIEFKAEVE